MNARTRRIIELRDEYRDAHPGCDITEAILWARAQVRAANPLHEYDPAEAMLDDACKGVPALRALARYERRPWEMKPPLNVERDPDIDRCSRGEWQDWE